MTDPEEVTRQRALLETHRQTLHHYLRQQAALGGSHTPPAVTHGVAEARVQIKRIKTMLQQRGVVVPDHHDDEASADVSIMAPAQKLHRSKVNVFGVVLLGGTVLLLIWLGRVLFAATIPTQEVSDSVAQTSLAVAQATAPSTAHPSVGLVSQTLTVTLPQSDTVTILHGSYGKMRYKILSAEVKPSSTGKALLHFSIRASVLEGGTDVGFGNDHFRLRINDQMLSPISYLNELVPMNGTKDGTVDFEIPSQPTQAHLVFLIGNIPAQLLIDIKAPGQDSSTPSTTSASPNMAVSLPQGDTVVIYDQSGQMTFQIIGAEVQQLSPGQSLLHLVIRATSGFRNDQGFGSGRFRLLINDQTLSSSNYFSESVLAGGTKDGVVEFPIPSQPAQARVTFDIGYGPQAEILLDIK